MTTSLNISPDISNQNGNVETRSTPVFQKMFSPKMMTFGVFFPIESFSGDQPKMEGQEKLAQRAEQLGFSALWFRDVPLHVPSFGDVGQIYDPFVYLGWIAAHTSKIALATGAVVLPLRHPLHTAKAAASVDQLSHGRLVLGISSGDRPQEFPAFGEYLKSRGEAFRDNLTVMRTALEKKFPIHDSSQYGRLDGTVDLIPKPYKTTIPMPIVGGCQQDVDWIAEYGDAWIMYPRPIKVQSQIIDAWKAAQKDLGQEHNKPFGQSLYVDILENKNAVPIPIHLGFRSGRNFLIDHLVELQEIGVNHVIFNLKYGSRPAAEMIEEIGEYIIPHFS